MHVMRWFVLLGLLLGCGSDGSSGPADAGSSGTSVGSGTVEGAAGFAVSTARWTDPGPFSGKSRIEINLANDPACGRARCATFQQLFLRLSAEGAVAPGRYDVIKSADAGATGSLEVRLQHGEAKPNGCSVGEQPGQSGSVTLESATAVEVKGTYDVDVNMVDGSVGKFTGRFTALKCP
jgi:hypothetical protein